MQLLDGILLVLALTVSAWMAWGTGRAARLVLFGSASLISAALFLPSSMLGAMAGTDGLALLEAGAKTVSWTLADIAHFIAFLWLALMLWFFRPGLRGWKIIVLLACLAIASELMQGLSADRSTRLGDIVVNLLGAGVGLGIGVMVVAMRKWLRPPIPVGENKS